MQILIFSHSCQILQKNLVTRLSDGMIIYTNQPKKAALVDQFYSNLIGKSDSRERTIDLEALGLPAHDLSELELPSLEQEVLDTIRSLPSDKAPRPEGFTGRFYKECWNTIKEDVLNAVTTIWNRNFVNLGRLNSTYITMIPKEGVDQMCDFRPISQVHSFAKLVTKILANRLSRRLNSLVSPCQRAFIKGRFIQGNFMLVQQTSRLLHQQNKVSLLFKLDITKAFDSVSWPFLIEVMQQMGFGQIWRDIICGLLGSSFTQVLLNGCPGNRIQNRRGLRQGNPLSPMLFILVMDVLGLLFSKAEEAGLLQLLSNRKKLHRISIYVDDVALFLHPTQEDISISLEILELFEDASGLRNNAQKSNIFPIRCSQHTILEVQNCLPCEIASFPCKYLELPLSLRKLNKDQFLPLVDKIANKLPNWKTGLMNRAGRRVLVQHVHTGMSAAMPIDFPKWAIVAIDKIRRGFLWTGRKEAKGGHCMVAQGKVCMPMNLGGLGISSFPELCWALRMRWLYG
jgi:hypothetical protein